ncbi:MAG: hypothetical protein AUK47_16790 [Deltaproteobacteria bacterium CG2_30_63_29]|nr:MAG: hypothetical protein AUK47_16790 [Deltaproteobacteria bacterium CG2_30_63_29]PJB40096.1 MAG: hypothetical protein CO108_15670 [Deltaproteobacteria bacterium CG_4_9_14_3_um_filter_63_12]
MKVPFALILILLSVCCTSCYPEACGGVACADGIPIQIVDSAGQRVEAFEATLTLDGVEQDASCPPLRGNYGGTECLYGSSGVSLWLKGNPAHLVLSVDSGGEQGTLDLTPQYRAQYPNGPDCGEGCRSADMVTVTLAPK